MLVIWKKSNKQTEHLERKCSGNIYLYGLLISGPWMLQRQAEVFGASSAEDLRGPSQVQQTVERTGARQTQAHAGARQVEPRVSVKKNRICFSYVIYVLSVFSMLSNKSCFEFLGKI